MALRSINAASLILLWAFSSSATSFLSIPDGFFEAEEIIFPLLAFPYSILMRSPYVFVNLAANLSDEIQTLSNSGPPIS